ncbi:cytochrome c oxidase subunit 3 [Falsiroseomonas sp. HW251]|uniref:cytochrome c oxidase subunit 3 n=1 Tax=Falsiroseomonas sp. HW251 TaxID=3390998 RepID=UPI003D312654
MSEALRKPWLSLQRQREATSFGLWVFLATEAMFFAAAILAYGFYRTLFPGPFVAAARESAIGYGTANTAILLTSSLFMAAGAEAARAGLRRMALRCLLLTILLGAAFLVVKGFEYAKDIGEGLMPGPFFRLDVPRAQFFWSFYWVATGVHAVHLAVGMVATGTLLLQAWWRSRSLASPAFEAVALYWHFVDAVWVLLFALIYLPGRS